MTDSMYLIEDYVTVTPGAPYRLFPFGKIVKGGKTRNVTPELAATFRLPHFKPPIKRGSHADDAPAGGHIKALEVRSDGLWAIPEFNENGLQDIVTGAYRYHSPEVIWSDGPVFEDPKTGKMIHGPLIVGDALLHMPHLGEAAALYSVEPIMEGNINMTEEKQTRWDKFMAWFDKEVENPVIEPKPAPESIVPEDYEALQVKAAQADKLQAEIDHMKAEAERTARIEKFAADLKETKASGDFAEVLAGMPDEVAAKFVQEFKALSEQIKESVLLDEKGNEGEGLPEDPTAALDAAVRAKMEAHKVDYNKALAMVSKESPELVNNKFSGGK